MVHHSPVNLPTGRVARGRPESSNPARVQHPRDVRLDGGHLRARLDATTRRSAKDFHHPANGLHARRQHCGMLPEGLPLIHSFICAISQRLLAEKSWVSRSSLAISDSAHPRGACVPGCDSG